MPTAPETSEYVRLNPRPIMIKFTAFGGTEEQLNWIMLVGPYPTEVDRDADLERFLELDDPDELTDFQDDETPAGDAERIVPPEALTDVRDAVDFREAFYNYRRA